MVLQSRKVFSLICASLALALAGPINRRQEPTFFISDDSLGEYYPYVVHLPSNFNNATDSSSLPPAVVMLGGTGSRGPVEEIQALATYNGIGRRLNEYQKGEYTDSSILAAEEFLSIIPIAPLENSTEWHIDVIPVILDQVQTTYGFDASRVFLLGFSMGARDGWKIALAYPGLFAGMAVAAGEPDSTYGNISSLVDMPIRHYQGGVDYVSVYESALETQSIITGAGGSKCELIVIPDINHNNMADAPFYAPLFEWLLSLNNATGGEPAVPSITTANSIGSVALPSSSASDMILGPTGFPMATSAMPSYLFA